jgi:CheY-like chemotaxis protein
MLAAMTAFRDGDFSAHLPDDRTGTDARIAEAFNRALAHKDRISREMSRLSASVGKEGRFRQRMSLPGATGGWARTVDALNALIDDLVRPTTEIARTIGAVAKGDLGQSMELEVDGRSLKGEFLRSAKLVNPMIEQLSLFTSEVTHVARVVGTEGKLDGQARVKGVSGVWKELTDSVNAMATNPTAQVRNRGRPSVHRRVRARADGRPARRADHPRRRRDAAVAGLRQPACQRRQVHRSRRLELAARRDGDEVRVTVTDNGIGIPVEKLRSVFVMFSQVEGALSRSRGGLGIGLTLVKHPVELHGGSVEAESPGLGGGSAFVVSLPLAEAHAAEPATGTGAASHGTSPASAGRLKILVVDDNRDGAETLSELLADLGYEVRMAHDGEAALREAGAFRPQVMLLDIGLPMLDGYEVCRRIRAESWGQRIGVIAMAGWGDAEAQRKGEEAGFDRHLTKPVEESLLLSALAGLRAASPRS